MDWPTIGKILTAAVSGAGITAITLLAIGKWALNKAIDARLKQEEIAYEHTFKERLVRIENELARINKKEEIQYQWEHSKRTAYVEQISKLATELIRMLHRYFNSRLSTMMAAPNEIEDALNKASALNQTLFEMSYKVDLLLEDSILVFTDETRVTIGMFVRKVRGAAVQIYAGTSDMAAYQPVKSELSSIESVMEKELEIVQATLKDVLRS